MTETTRTIREQAFLPMSGDVPEGMTLAQYRAERPPAQPTRPRKRRRRRAQPSTK